MILYFFLFFLFPKGIAGHSLLHPSTKTSTTHPFLFHDHRDKCANEVKYTLNLNQWKCDIQWKSTESETLTDLNLECEFWRNIMQFSNLNQFLLLILLMNMSLCYNKTDNNKIAEIFH